MAVYFGIIVTHQIFVTFKLLPNSEGLWLAGAECIQLNAFMLNAFWVKVTCVFFKLEHLPLRATTKTSVCCCCCCLFCFVCVCVCVLPQLAKVYGFCAILGLVWRYRGAKQSPFLTQEWHIARTRNFAALKLHLFIWGFVGFCCCCCWYKNNYRSKISTFCGFFLMFIFLGGEESSRERGRHRIRSQLQAQSWQQQSYAGLEPWTVRSRLEPKLDA